MFSTISSGAICGITSFLISVEVDASDGLPCFNMVGLPSMEVREAGERVKVALKNTGFRIPAKHITVNLSPADIKKEGVTVDLPVAVGILVSTGNISEDSTKNILFIGELGLDGDLKPVRGVLPIVQKAAEYGFKTCILPIENAKEGAVVEGIDIIGMKSLSEVITYLDTDVSEQSKLFEPTRISINELFNNIQKENVEKLDFSDINGQAGVKRAAEIAAAGFHHILISGPPGSGKSMIAKRIPTILPPFSLDEALEVSTIYSVAGLLNSNEALISKRPFMSPHHSVTTTALTGGGRVPQPGVISLAHRGVLFLDELAEFSRSTLDLLRQPLEDHTVHIARVGGNFTYPADFMMVGAMNPCPCGFFPDRNKCSCTDFEIKRYHSHISGPILDRMDLCVEAPKIDVSELDRDNSLNESSKVIRQRVLRARDIQAERFEGTGLRFNSDMEARDIKKYCVLGSSEKRLVEQIFHRMDLSARSYHRMIKVARTIADLDGSRDICENHITEAACYRTSTFERHGLSN